MLASVVSVTHLRSTTSLYWLNGQEKAEKGGPSTLYASAGRHQHVPVLQLAKGKLEPKVQTSQYSVCFHAKERSEGRKEGRKEGLHLFQPPRAD